MSDEVRLSIPGDEPGLMELWKSVFGDPEEYIQGFFDKLYDPGSAYLYVHEGRIVSAVYVIKLGDLIRDGRWTPCKVIYAYGTDPVYRGRGYGSQVLKAALDHAATAGVAAVCPAESSLYGYYADQGFQTFFAVSERHCTDVGSPLSGSVTRVTVRGYAALREELLYGRAHIDYDMRTLEYQEHLCSMSGGGLYYVVSDGIRCCAAVELWEGEARIKELIVPSGSQYNAAALVARAVRCDKFTYRAPVRPGDESTPFAMLSGPACEDKPELSPWFGFDFN